MIARACIIAPVPRDMNVAIADSGCGSAAP